MPQSAPESATAAEPRPVFRKDYRPPAFLVDTVELDFELAPGATRVRSRLSLRRNPEGPAEEDLFLHGEDLELLALRLDGEPLEPGRYEQTAEGLTVRSVPGAFTLETEVRIRPEENTRLEGLYRSQGTWCTQCEAEGFRRITFHLDRPDVLSRYTVTITGDPAECPVMLSNGNRVAEEELADGRRRVRWVDPFPKPSYLFALVAGRLECRRDRFTTRSGREVELEIWVQPRDLDKTAHAMESLKAAMRWDEETFGLEYDLDNYMIVAVPDFNMGAMENKGLNIFNTKYVLARPDTATDDDYEGILGVIGHEYFHNWTGNRVTCRDWFQLSLKEGLTVYRDQRFSSDLGSAPVKRIQDVDLLRTRQFPEDAGPMAHPVRPESYIEMNNFYTLTVYYKGAEVVRMYERILGREGFRRGMDLYFERHDGQAVTCDDFRRAMADANGVDLERFDRWYSQAGTPRVRASGHWEPETGRYRLDLEQDCPPTPGQERKEPFPIPVLTALLGRESGRLLPLCREGEDGGAAPRERVLLLEEERASFVFTGLEEEPVPSLLRDFSAPVRLEMERPREDLALLLARDTDGFQRWDAAQVLYEQAILEGARRFREGRALEPDPLLSGAFGSLVEEAGQPEADRSLLACILRLPALEYLLERQETADVEALHEARRFLRRSLAEEHGAALEVLYDRLRSAGRAMEERHDQEAIGLRRLQNACLAWLAARERPEDVERAFQQFQEARTMTDSLAALSVLAHLEVPEREQALAAFYERWKEEALVLDKWFAVQAGSTLPGTLERVQALLGHPAFDLRNPNKVRALLGTFAQANPLRFHAPDGSGYAFLADRILELDPLNPQVAARLAGAFGRWRRFPPEQGEKARAALERILAREGLSRDVYEIVSKSLEA